MRPTKLEMVGFGAFRQPTTIDFEDIDLAAFVGQTGAGKSTVIDAITFALYGSVSRYESVNVVAPVVHQLSNEARVKLDFEIRGESYSATRVVRRLKSDDPLKPRATTKEARLEQTVDGEPKTLAGNVRELDASVESLLGLNFAQFTRTIVLPQGEFAKFLKDDPADRQKLIRRLLDLEVFAEMGRRAREQVKANEAKVSVLEAERSRYQEIDEQSISSEQKRLEDVQAFQTSSLSVLEDLAKLTGEIDPLDIDLKACANDLELLKSVQSAELVSAHIGDLEIPEITKELEQLDAELEPLMASREKKLLEQSSVDELDVVRQQLKDYDRLDELEAKHLDFDKASTAANELLLKASQELSKAESEQSKLQTKLDSAKQSSASEVIRASLSVGDDCPVCEQEVIEVPSSSGQIDIPKLITDLDRAATTVSELSAQVHKQNGRIEQLDQEAQVVSSELVSLRKEVAGFEGKELLEKKLHTSREIAEQIRAMDDELAASRSARDKVAKKLRKAQETESGLLSSFVGIRDSVSHLDPPALSNEGVQAGWITFSEWVANKIESLVASVEAINEKRIALVDERDELTSGLVSQANSIGIEAASVDHLAESVREFENQITLNLVSLERQRTESKRLADEIRIVKKEATELKTLGDHMRANGFEGWLLSEALGEIVARATRRLLDLSGGQYSLEVIDRNFLIVDHNNAGERRDVKTLSGGETFLASLALALALADSIIELSTGGDLSLGAMFLDEGFGTLDSETLDVAASAIEELSSTGRMVCVVTHVRELAERLPVRFEVSKGPNTAFVEKVEV